jgi:endo-1,4-beta-D-glucanase Y
MRASSYRPRLPRRFPPLAALTVVTFAAAVAVGCAQANMDPGGTAGTNGGTGTGGSGNSPPPPMCGQETPAPAANGANFPFPQHRLSANCGYPTNCNDADISTSWTTYKSKLVVSATGGMRVQRPENSNDTVSEGIAYGMLMSVVMADKATFDGLWGFAKTKRNGSSLMSWHLNSDGSVASGGAGAASDADEDMAFALVMADKQWGGYTSDATTQIAAILNKEVSSSNVFLPDDSGNASSDINPSYLSPAYYRVFATVSGQTRWNQVVDQAYTTLNKCANGTTGLVADWCTQSGGASNRGMTYSYDAARTPFRVALDACWNNESRAVTFLAKMGTFFNAQTNVVDGYNLDGTPASGMRYPGQAAFVGPAGAAGMPANLAQLLRNSYASVTAVTKTGTSSAFNYYNGSWGVLSAMLMTGNFVNLAGL